MFDRLRLSTKFTVVFVVIFIGAILVSGVILYRTLERRAENEVTTRGLLMLETMNSVRAYTSEQVQPQLADQLATSEEFISESVPAFSAREVFENFRESETYEDFLYKEATLNPTNPRNRADGFETEIVERFRADPSLSEQTGFRTLNGTRVFYIARPLTIGRESCLQCHSTSDAAPASMINTYGTDGGFGWELGETVAAQMIYVPAEEVFDNAQMNFALMIGIFLAVFAIVILALNLLLRPMVVRPVTQLAGLAGRVGEGEVTDDDLNTLDHSAVSRRGDELGQLARVFGQMAHQVQIREAALRRQVQELRVEVDSARKTRDVSEITENEYFKSLQQRAKDLRRQQSSSQKPDETASDTPPEAD